MQKINKTFISLVVSLMLLALSATATKALILSIQTLPTYINYNSFKLSCTSDGSSAQFYYSENGGAFTAFGGSIDLTSNQCLVQVDSNVINDQTTYAFKVKVDGTDSSTVSTIYDSNGPGTPSGYYKEGLADGFRIHWRNPNDSDFSVVKIYRGDTSDFSADNSHEVTTQAGGGDSQMTFEDHFSMESGKTYYYILRAVDKAGNSSGLVGDSVTTTVTSTPKPGSTAGGTGGSVVQVPSQGGSVLGTETGASGSPAPTAVSTSAEEDVNSIGKVGLFRWILTHKKMAIGILAGAALLGYGVYYFFLKKK